LAAVYKQFLASKEAEIKRLVKEKEELHRLLLAQQPPRNP
jgi:hypothetical protein